MPHIDIKRFTIPLHEDQKVDHAGDLPAMTPSVFGCNSEAASIALGPVAPFPADRAATQPANSEVSR